MHGFASLNYNLITYRLCKVHVITAVMMILPTLFPRIAMLDRGASSDRTFPGRLNTACLEAATPAMNS